MFRGLKILVSPVQVRLLAITIHMYKPGMLQRYPVYPIASL